jgi:hypothetical protein
MSSPEVVAAAQRIFVLVHRSFTQFLLHDAWPNFDVRADEMLELAREQRCDADRLGEAIVRAVGTIYVGQYSMAYGDLHFLNASRILIDWLAAERELVANLEKESAALDGSTELLAQCAREVVENEKGRLARLETIASDLHVTV